MIWLATLQGRIVTVAAALMAVWGWFKLHDSKVATQERARITKATENAANNGASAAAKSTAGGVRAKRDPLTRD